MREEAALSRRSARCCASRRTSTRAAARAGGGAAVGPLRHAAAQHRAARCCPITTSTSPIGTTRATCRSPTAASASTTMSTTSSSSCEAIGARRARARGLPALRAGARGRAVMAQAGNPAQPRSMTLMAGPIDTRVNPTKVNELAKASRSTWFEKNLIARGADALPGRGPQGLSRLRAARRLHVHEHRPPRQGAPRAVRAPGQGRAREGRRHQGVLRRVFRGARPRGRVLPGDGAVRVPGAPAAEGRARHGAASRSIRAPSAAPRC